MNILITGVSKGIGRSIALEFAKNNHNIIGCSRSDLNGLKETEYMVKNMGVDCYTSLCDVSNEDAVKEFIFSVSKKFKSIDVLVNNAGISYQGLIQDMSLNDWHNIINTNLTSVFLMCKYIIPGMITLKSGHIINISSVWGNIGACMEAAYSASKGGLNAFTKALSKELAPSNISVNAIAPGFIDTAMNASLDSDELESIFNEIPIGRAGETEEVAELVYKIATSKYITGQIITIDGGWT